MERAGKLAPISAAATTLVQDAKDAKEATKKAGEAQPEDWAAAILTLTPYGKAVTDLENALTAHENNKQQYEARRAKLSDDEEAVGRIKTPVTPLKELVEAYQAAVATTKGSLDKGEFDAALASMDQLEKDLKAAVAEKRKGIEKDVKAKVDGIMNDLDADNGGHPVWHEPHLPGTPGQEWKDSVTKILAVQLDEDFKARYDKKCEAVAKLLVEDPLVKEANTKWADWAKDPVTNKDKMLAVMNQVVKLQSQVIGVDPVVPVKLMDPPGGPTLCGQFNAGTRDIDLNPALSNFDDFRELLDTLTHENTHALQDKLVKQYELYPEDPDRPRRDQAGRSGFRRGHVVVDERQQGLCQFRQLQEIRSSGR